MLCRNRKVIIIISVIVSVSLNCMFLIEVWMVVVWLVSICMLRLFGRVDCSCGSSVLIWLIILIMLVFGWCWMFSIIVGRLLV